MARKRSTTRRSRPTVSRPVKKSARQSAGQSAKRSGKTKPRSAAGPAVGPTKQARTLMAARIRAEKLRDVRGKEFDRALAAAAKKKAGISPASSRAGSTRAGRGTETQPALRIYAEGDSWFDFPLEGDPFEGGDVIERLEDLIPFPILCDAVAGDEARNMLGVKQRARLEAQLNDQRRDFNVLLFSGGGNDIVGEPFCLWLNDASQVNSNPDRALNPAFDAMLAVVRRAYEELIAMRDAACARRPGRRIVIFLHAYDWAIPDGRGVCRLFGPWLRPSLEAKGWMTRSSDPMGDGFQIVKAALTQFATMLAEIARNHPDVVLIQTQGTLTRGQWHDELHPKRGGFLRMAELFRDALQAQFPDAFAI